MVIIFDIGGTKTRIARMIHKDKFESPVIFNTPARYKDGIALIKETVKKISKNESVDIIAGGFAGPIERKTSRIVMSPNLPDWAEKPLKDDLARFFSAKVYLENDSAMVALGEATHGVGVGFPIVVYITISTGVGGARIVNGKIDERVIGFEPGHQIVDMDKTVIPESSGYDLESMIGGRWVEARVGKRPQNIMDDKFWDGIARILAAGLNNTIVHWSPDVVILGGSMMNKIGVPLDRVESHLRQMIRIYPTLPEIKAGKLGEAGGLYGALSYLKNLNI